MYMLYTCHAIHLLLIVHRDSAAFKRYIVADSVAVISIIYIYTRVQQYNIRAQGAYTSFTLFTHTHPNRTLNDDIIFVQ